MATVPGPTTSAGDDFSDAVLRQRLRHIADTAPAQSVAAVLEIIDSFPPEKDPADPKVAAILHADRGALFVRPMLAAVVKFAKSLPSELDRAISALTGSDTKAAFEQAFTAAAGASAERAAEVLISIMEGKDPEKSLCIRIKQALTGETLGELQAKAATTVLSLKVQIAELPGIRAPPGRLRLLRGSAPLDNTTTLAALVEGEGETGSSADMPLDLLLVRLQDYEVRRVHSHGPEVQNCGLLKLLLVGDAVVGKTSILAAYRGDTISGSYVATIGVDFSIVNVVANDTMGLKLQVWDTAGQDRFRTITSAYYRGANGVIIVFDVTQRGTFDSVDRFLEDIGKYGNDEVAKVLVGNKAEVEDDQRQVTREEAEAAAAQRGLRYFELWAAKGEVEGPFNYLVGQILDQRRI